MRHVHRFVPLMGVVLLVALIVGLGPSLVERFAYAAVRGAGTADREALADLSQREQLGKLFRTVARTVKPAVVEVRVKTKVAVQRMPDIEDFFRRFEGDKPGPFFRNRRPRRRQHPQYRFRRGLGSGVIVDDENGYILTNHHVVGGADQVEIVLADGRKFQAEWIRSDPRTDLAVIKIDADRLAAAPLGDSDEMDVGDLVLAIGSPEGLQQTVTAGIVSAKGRTTARILSGGYQNFIQTDAAINKGNSGGPLVNMRGEIIGINTAIVSRTGVNEGIGLAIPSNMAGNVMRQLVDKGKVVRGFLGVVIQDVDEELAGSFNLPHSKGALVTRVLEDSPAARAGIKEEDFIVSVDGQPVENVNGLRNKVADLSPGKEVDFTLYHQGKKKTVSVKISIQPEDMNTAFGDSGEGENGKASPQRYGVKAQALTEALAERFGYEQDVEGVVIVKVDPDSDAYEKGLRPGMVVDRVNGKKVTTAEELASAVAGAEKGLRLRIVMPRGGRRYVFILPK